MFHLASSKKRETRGNNIPFIEHILRREVKNEKSTLKMDLNLGD